MKIKENPQRNKLQNTIIVVAGIIIVACILTVIHSFVKLGDTLEKEPNMKILCENDNEVLYYWWNGFSITNYDFCPKCGGKLEEVGIVNLESCIKCNTEINKKDKYCSSCGTENKKQKANRWLKEKECTSFNECKNNFWKKIVISIAEIFISLIAFTIALLMIANSNRIFQKIVSDEKEKRF